MPDRLNMTEYFLKTMKLSSSYERSKYDKYLVKCKTLNCMKMIEKHIFILWVITCEQFKGRKI